MMFVLFVETGGKRRDFYAIKCKAAPVRFFVCNQSLQHLLEDGGRWSLIGQLVPGCLLDKIPNCRQPDCQS